MHGGSYLDKTKLITVLSRIISRVEPEENQIDYRLVGTGAALLRGLELPTRDIDILVRTRADVEHFSKKLLGYVCTVEPSFIEYTRQYFTEYLVDGVDVGISTVELESDDIWRETYGSGPWIHHDMLPCGDYLVPSVGVELGVFSQLFRDRPERYEPMLDYLVVNGFNVDILREGIEYLSDEQRTYVMRKLSL